MEAKIVKEFNTAVDIIFNNAEIKDILYNYLKHYRSNLDLPVLLSRLKSLITRPEWVPIYEAIRPLIPIRHQLPYDRAIQGLSPGHYRMVRITRRPSGDPGQMPSGGGFGFALRGGLEHDTGVFISDVVPESVAWKQGLRVGDQVVRVNGFPLDQVTHDEALSLMKSRQELILKIRRVGLVPSRRPSEQVVWEYASDIAPTRSIPAIEPDSVTGVWRSGSGSDQVMSGEHFRIFVNLSNGGTLGCTICSGALITGESGVFVQTVREGSLAENVGLLSGDQIMQANGLVLEGLSHSHAVLALKCTPYLYLTVKRGAGPAPSKSVSSSITDREMAEQLMEASKLRKLYQLTNSSHSASEGNLYQNGYDEGPFTSNARGRDDFIVKETVNLSASYNESSLTLPNADHYQFTREETDDRPVVNTAIIREPRVRSLGFEVETENVHPPSHRVIVSRVYFNSSAMSADVGMGDYLLKLDGKVVSRASINDVKLLIDRLETDSHKRIIELTLAKAAPGMYEEEITYF